MKKLITILLICLIITSSHSLLYSMPRQKPMLGTLINWPKSPSNCVGIWLMNERCGRKVYDLSGNGYDGTFGSGAESPSWSSGISGCITDYDGGDHVSMGINPFPNLTEWTVIAKFKLDGTGADQAIIDKTDGSTEDEVGNTNHEIAFLTGTSKVSILYEYGAGTNVRRSTSTSVTSGVWYTVAGAYGNGSLDVYLNGILDNGVLDGDPSNPPTGSTTAEFVFGKLGLNDSTFLDGQIDYVLLYNKALTATEIHKLYREPFCMFRSYLPITGTFFHRR